MMIAGAALLLIFLGKDSNSGGETLLLRCLTHVQFMSSSYHLPPTSLLHGRSEHNLVLVYISVQSKMKIKTFWQ